LMDEQDKPRGLFGLFGGEDDAASPKDDGVDREKEARWAADPVFQDARLEELRSLLTLPDPDPETRAFLRTLSAAGDIATGSAAVATNFGPWARWGLGGPTRFVPRSGPGTTIVPQTSPGPLVSAPQAAPAESQSYSSPRLADAEAEPLPGSDFLFGVPQAEKVESRSYGPRLPSKAKVKKEEKWKVICDEVLDRFKARCDERYSYVFDDNFDGDPGEYWACRERAFGAFEKCRREKWEWMPQWSDIEANGGLDTGENGE
jgi:hypothetical protein